MEALFASVDLSPAQAWAGTIGLVIVAIALAFKAVSIAKRGISKA